MADVEQKAAGSKTQQAYDWLREQIRTRALEPGHRLVLTAIAEDLGISVVPVREAIRQLEAEGMVTYERNVGARVTTLNREAYFQTMETVALLEGKATAEAVPYIGEEDLAAARDINSRMRALLSDFDPVAFTAMNQDFHRVLFRYCGNERLLDLLESEWERLQYFRVSTFRYVPDRAWESVEEHERLAALIAAGAEAEYIEKVARTHRLKTAEAYRARIEKSTEPAAKTDSTGRMTLADAHEPAASH